MAGFKLTSTLESVVNGAKGTFPLADAAAETSNGGPPARIRPLLLLAGLLVPQAAPLQPAPAQPRACRWLRTVLHVASPKGHAPALPARPLHSPATLLPSIRACCWESSMLTSPACFPWPPAGPPAGELRAVFAISLPNESVARATGAGGVSYIFALGPMGDPTAPGLSYHSCECRQRTPFLWPLPSSLPVAALCPPGAETCTPRQHCMCLTASTSPVGCRL